MWLRQNLNTCPWLVNTTQTVWVSDHVTRKIGPLDFMRHLLSNQIKAVIHKLYKPIIYKSKPNVYTLEFRCRILYEIQGSSAWPKFQLIYLSENPVKCSIKGKLKIIRNWQRHLSNFPSKVIWCQDIVFFVKIVGFLEDLLLQLC